MASGQEEEPDLLQQLVVGPPREQRIDDPPPPFFLFFFVFFSPEADLPRQDSFHTLLDETLIVAVAGDYDLHDAAAYEQAHSLLKELAQSVPSEEASGFNASGIPQDVAREPSATSSTSGSRQTSGPHVTDKSSSDSASSVPDAPDVVPKLTSFDEDSTRDKLLTLQSMFAELKVYDVEYSLTKADGDFQVALDDLLNVHYLQSTGQQPKGLEAFFAPAQGSAQGKRGRKRKGRLTGTAEANPSGPRPKASLGAQSK